LDPAQYDPGVHGTQSSALSAPVMLLYVPDGHECGFDDPTAQ
jgi:hypothetical protein